MHEAQKEHMMYSYYVFNKDTSEHVIINEYFIVIALESKDKLDIIITQNPLFMHIKPNSQSNMMYPALFGCAVVHVRGRVRDCFVMWRLERGQRTFILVFVDTVKMPLFAVAEVQDLFQCSAALTC
ncbi:hypothetical protein ACJX0J_005333 [Zea mays]